MINLDNLDPLFANILNSVISTPTTCDSKSEDEQWH